MRTLDELRNGIDVALDDDDWCEIEDIVIESLRHVSGFAGGEWELWETDDVKELCHELGDKVYDKWGMKELKAIHNTIYCELGPIAARLLEHFWNGCGDGAWRS